MSLSDDIKLSLAILNNTNVITDQVYKKLLEITLQDLLQSKATDVKSLNATKPDVIKQVHATLLKIFLLFAQQNISKEKALSILCKDCRLEANRCKLLVEQYDKHKMQLVCKLGNVGSHLPHIVDVDWEIDLLIKSSAVDSSQSPLFKITLVTECFDKITQGKKLENVQFWGTSQEMQDLVYKLEDAVRHCQKIATGH